MLKKAIAFFSALVLSAAAVGALAVTAAEDWHEYLHASSTFTATDYDGLIQLRSGNGKTTMRVNSGGFAGNYKYLDVIPYSYNRTTRKYTELSADTGSIEDTAQSLAASIKTSTTYVGYICSIGTVCNTTDSHAGTYKTLVSHIRKDKSYAVPDPWITYNN